MLVVEIDRIYAQTLKAGITGFANILWGSVDTESCSIWKPLIPKLCGEDHPLTLSSNRFSDQHFIRERAIHICGV